MIILADRSSTGQPSRLAAPPDAGAGENTAPTNVRVLPVIVRVLIAAAMTAALLAAWAIWMVLQDPLGVARILQNL
jgi:hypothetical protein